MVNTIKKTLLNIKFLKIYIGILFLSMWSLLAYKYNYIIYFLLFLIPVYIIEIKKGISNKFKLTYSILSIVLINLLYYLDKSPISSSNVLKPYIFNSYIIYVVNFFFFYYIFFLLLNIFIRINEKKVYIFSVVCFLLGCWSNYYYNNYIKYLPYLYIIIYSLALSFCLSRLFSKKICLELLIWYDLVLLISLILVFLLALGTVEGYYPQNRYFLFLNCTHMNAFFITSVMYVIFLLMPNKYFEMNVSLNPKYIMVTVLLLLLNVVPQYYPMFSQYFKGE